MHWGVCIMSLMLYVKTIVDTTSLLKSFHLLRSGFQRAIYDVSKFFPVLVLIRAFELTAHVK